MKPPEDNIWIETSAGEGKVYYYNSKTRETSWNRPENAVIMTQEQMAAAYRPPLLPSLGSYHSFTVVSALTSHLCLFHLQVVSVHFGLNQVSCIMCRVSCHLIWVLLLQVVFQ